jgi:signal transduction histidine kinase
VGRGTGQGLAIAMTVINRHDATITFDSEPGEGTTFHVKLPIGDTADDAPSREATGPVAHAAGER